ncbi:MAG: hypothetical protein Q7S37_01645 [bacterium]|nr:hypothetical protein [bacterium]
MNEIPVFYCLECGYVGNAPGICPQCSATLVADDMNLPNEKEEDGKYDEAVLEDEEEDDELPEDKFEDEE